MLTFVFFKKYVLWDIFCWHKGPGCWLHGGVSESGFYLALWSVHKLRRSDAVKHKSSSNCKTASAVFSCNIKKKKNQAWEMRCEIYCNALFTMWNIWGISIQPNNQSLSAAFGLVIQTRVAFQRGKRWRRTVGWALCLFWDRFLVSLLHGVEQRCSSVCERLAGREERRIYRKRNLGSIVSILIRSSIREWITSESELTVFFWRGERN